MPRAVIAVVVAVVIAALTAIAIVVTSASFDERSKKDSVVQLTHRAFPVVQKLAQLQGIDIYSSVERLAGDSGVIAALQTKDPVERKNQSDLAFQRFIVANGKKDIDTKPDVLALVDKDGFVIATAGSSNIVAKLWQNEKGEITVPPLKLTLTYGKRMIVSDIWDDGDRGMMRIGVAPVVDPTAADPDAAVGAAVVAYAQTAREAQHTELLLGTEIAYYINGRVIATSFTRGKSGDEDTAKTRPLTELLKAGKISDAADQSKPTRITLDGVDYYAAAVAMPRSFSKPPPADYPPMTAGAMLLAPIVDPGSTAGTVKLMIGLVGGGAIAIALLGLFLLYRRLMGQVDQLEIGIADIINGNVDRTFRPVGAELDGLANGLNVMLARLFGRAEPGEEELDDDGNPVPSSNMEFEDGGEASDAATTAADPELAALAQESEPDYYKRVWTEYVAARAAAGKPDEVSFENFIAKLKVNEGKLKAQYECRAVRFRVVTKDGKVSLKPVPIFA